MARTPEEALRYVEQVAKAAGLTLLTRQWEGGHASCRFRCPQGHEFERRPFVLEKRSARCPQCARDAIRQRFLALLERNGWTCLEGDYLGANVRHHFQCAQGHRWDTEARKILEGSGCHACATARAAEKNTRADGLERLRAAAAAHGGRCLADAYAGIIAKYEWECAAGHRWHASGQSVVRGNWCRVCFGLRHSERMLDADGLARLHDAAASRGGACLDSVYTGVHSQYRFRCAAGHEWHTGGMGVLGGAWCPRCAVQRTGELSRVPDGLEQLRAVAASHGGEVVSAVYAGIAARYTFRCARGHEWTTKGTHVLQDGTWCQRCAGLRRRHTIAEMQALARERGGRCLSPEYLGVKVPLTWECHRGHVWPASPDSVLNGGTWCRNCAILEKTKKAHLRLKYDYEGKR